mmetsp:Transcript_62209/g.148417  ORF Transcript_62209/g.148417 Transcript_62209/m.148417 type:complete len:409 (-) Transcript_62209:97-1323(-)|eukprot:CAMPEP_0178393366 /NCGR_PEP_ID=MMETSP0689_2-20121128/12148_1 /TAXON_ID=160604 /ORGANISM="Amphidinium massartii, Strain CS-259" /LENGTH=408 /DNA_ID=CAMNT_0020013951 /DNA_START=28 /DNA_END=1254 /DNA_ORIENTATION=+
MAAKDGQSRGIGVDRIELRCWEYYTLTVNLKDVLPLISPFKDDEPVETDEISIVSALFGVPGDKERSIDVTNGVRELLKEGYDLVAASVTAWGDPAPWTCKELVITLDYRWLQSSALQAYEALYRRGSEKATAAEQQVLLTRLAAALRSTIGPRAGEEANADTPSSGVASSSSHLPPLSAVSPRWKRLGFQNNDPRTDLRTGRLALEALVYFAERYPMAASQMVVEAQSSDLDYPFAVASINVTQHLLRYLGLLLEDRRGAPLHVIRKFASLLSKTTSDDVDLFGELHAAAFNRLHTTWQSMKRSDPTVNVMSFGVVMDDMVAAVHRFLSSAQLCSASELRNLPHVDSGFCSSELPMQRSGEAYDAVRSAATSADSALKAAAVAVSESTDRLRGYFGGMLAGNSGEAA